MLQRVCRPIVSPSIRLPCAIRDLRRRKISVISRHSSFPASLLRLNAGSMFKPFSFERQAMSEYKSAQDDDGSPKANPENAATWPNLPFSDGATLMPNTFTMQEIIRMAVDDYYDDVENGVSVERPYIFTIPKGTPVPETLVLLRERTARFSLQASQPISSDVLNKILDEFYSKHGEKRDADEWLDDHDYPDAFPDDAEKEWMAR